MKHLYNPELSEVIAYLEYKIINNECTDNDVMVYNKLVYGEKASKSLVAKLIHRMDKELVS